MSILGDYIITNISFGKEGIRIDYMEQRFQTDGAGLESGLTLVDLDDTKTAVIVEIQAVLSDFIDEYKENLPDRNRPDTLPDNRFQRIRKGDDGNKTVDEA